MTAITTHIDNLDGLAPLYHRYAGQTEAQTAYIALDEYGDVHADYNGEIGTAVPVTVWHGRTLRWDVPSNATGAALTAFLGEEQTQALLRRVHDGHSVVWDGHNHVGRLTDDATAASDELELLIERWFSPASETSPVWEVGDWLFGSCTLLEHWTTQPLAEAVATIEANAEADGVMLDGDVEKALLDMAWYWFDTGRPGLTSAHVTALLEHERITADEAATAANAA